MSLVGDFLPKCINFANTLLLRSVGCGLFRGELEVDLLRLLPGKNISVQEPLRFVSGVGDLLVSLPSGILSKTLCDPPDFLRSPVSTLNDENEAELLTATTNESLRTVIKTK